MKREQFKKKYSEESYIGDGVYATFDGYHILLRADENRIGLEPEVMDRLFNYEERLKKDIAEIKGKSDE